MTTTLSTPTTVTAFPSKLLHFPPNDLTLNALRGRIMAKKDTQQTAASANTYAVAFHAGKLLHLRLGVSVAPASGETMTIDVHMNTVSILKAPVELVGGTSPDGYYDLTAYLLPNNPVSPGAIFEFIRTYVAGGGPAAPVTELELEWG